MDINKLSDTNMVMTENQLQAERIRVLYQQVPSVLLGNLFISLILVAFLYTYTADVVSLYWLLVVIVISIIRFLLLKQYRRESRDDSNIIYWGWVFALTAFVSGCVWGATSILFSDTSNPVIMIFLLMTLTGITVGSSASLSNYALSYFVFAIPTILPYSYVLIATSELVFIALSMMLVVFLILQLVVAKKNQDTLDRSIILRNENAGLVHQLTIKKEKAEFASSEKTRFLAAASHDLRQPLHAMSLLLSVLDATDTTEEQHLIIEKIKKSSLSLENILQELLDISKLDAGVVDIDIKTFKVQKLFDVLYNDFKSIAAEKNLSIDFVATTLGVKSDIHILERILRNLISNAIRYTEKGKVVVGCRRRGNVVKICVLDTGIGIENDKIDIIFKEFQQLDNHARDREKGLGLGLSIVERLTDLLAIRCDVLSVPGKGSVFSVETERAFIDTAADAELAEKQSYPKLANKIIVVIEDEEEIRQALKLLLNSWGCQVAMLCSVAEVNEKMSGLDSVDMILADYRLQDFETGVDVVAAIHSYFDSTAIPAVIITGDTGPERLKEIKSSGFEMINKPVSGGKLRAVLNSVLLSK
ncbi:MAG: ATP-binding protein [Gammaproteobacteria bacterium]|nr:ATP-binding protein [Gammaproteobacteria bacterium]